MSQSEHDIQEMIFLWAYYTQAKRPELGVMYAIPNGGKRDIVTAVKLKREGVKAGVPDICLPVPRMAYNALYMELKAKGGRASDAQKNFMHALTAQGNYCRLVWGFDDAVKVIEDYLDNKL